MTSELYTQYQSFRCALCVYMYRCASICFIYTYVCIHTHTHLPACVHVNIILLAFKGHTLLLVWSCNLLLLLLLAFGLAANCSHPPPPGAREEVLFGSRKQRGRMLNSFGEKLEKVACFHQLCIPQISFLPSSLPLLTLRCALNFSFLFFSFKNLSIYFLGERAGRIFIISRKKY